MIPPNKNTLNYYYVKTLDMQSRTGKMYQEQQAAGEVVYPLT
jgi:hypothetical protein